MIDHDVVVAKARELLDSLQGREGVQGAAMLGRASDGIEGAADAAEADLHCHALARALRGIERQGTLTPDEFALALQIHEAIDAG